MSWIWTYLPLLFLNFEFKLLIWYISYLIHKIIIEFKQRERDLQKWVRIGIKTKSLITTTRPRAAISTMTQTLNSRRHLRARRNLSRAQRCVSILCISKRNKWWYRIFKIHFALHASFAGCGDVGSANEV